MVKIMNKIIQALESIKLNKIFVVFFAGILLFVSTACSSSNSTDVADRNPGKDAHVKTLSTNKDVDYDYYDANQPKQGGMNKYNDDPRYDRSDLKAKSEELVDRAKANVSKSPDFPGGYVEEVSDAASNSYNRLKNNVPRKIDEIKENASEGIQDRFETTKKNLDRASQDISRATENISDSAEDSARATRRAMEDGLDRIGSAS
jgi:hypothetical protein